MFRTNKRGNFGNCPLLIFLDWWNPRYGVGVKSYSPFITARGINFATFRDKPAL